MGQVANSQFGAIRFVEEFGALKIHRNPISIRYENTNQSIIFKSNSNHVVTLMTIGSKSAAKAEPARAAPARTEENFMVEY